MTTSTTDSFAAARAIWSRAQDKLAQLQNIQPYFIDLSLRENSVGSRVGQTLAEKLAILPQLRQFGFSNILLGTLDYSIPDELEVDDDFLMHLRDNNIDMTGGFVFSDIGQVNPDNSFTPSPSMLKMQSYGVPNTLHEIYLSDAGMSGQYTIEQLMASLPASIAWVNDNIVGDGGGKPRILINIVDGCDAFAQNPERTCQVMALLSQQQIQGISIEDDRGTFMPFQVGAIVEMARQYLPVPFKILVHMHAGGGFENASVIEALLCGADGVWGGLPKRAAIIGHASLGELISNLVRAGNQNMQQTYQLNQLLTLASGLQVLDDEEPLQPDLPILGSNAYRCTLDFFRQIPGRFMDLIPETIGGSYGYRICPLVSDPPVIAGRLSEITGSPPSVFPTDVLIQMIRLMRRDLRAGLRIIYDEPDQLLNLYARAAAPPTSPP
jgi:hypothetical protein